MFVEYVYALGNPAGPDILIAEMRGLGNTADALFVTMTGKTLGVEDLFRGLFCTGGRRCRRAGRFR